MINKQLQDAINAQINAELWSAYLYLSMATNFHEMGLGGIANWFEVQFKEEQDHAMIFYNYLVSRGGRVELKAIDAVKTKWESPLEAFEDTLEHEQKVTSLINDINALAVELKDYATQNRLVWFIDEQVEEEESAQELIDKFSLIGDNGMGLYMLDQELGARVFNTPSPLATAE